MLELVYNPDWHELRRYAQEQLVRSAQRGEGGRVLIVPEQYSFETERALCEAGGPKISRYAEVLSFSRLAERALAQCGGIARPVMDQGGRLMAMGAAVEQVRPKLKFFARSAQRADFLSQLCTIVDELKCYRVDSRQLQRASEQLEGALAVKTQELALLLEGYEALCAHGLQDPRDRLELLCGHIAERGFGGSLRLYVEGFLGFTALELEIIGAFLSRGADVTVCLCCDGLFDGAQVFAGVRSAASALMGKADGCGAMVRQIALPGQLSPLHALSLSAFTGKPAENSDGLHLYKCTSPKEEVRTICADILAHVRAGGRYRDIAVACADQTVLRPLLEAEFARCKIPAFFAGKLPALRTPLLSGLIRALRAACGQMEQEDVLAYLKSDGSPLHQEECDLLENYALLWDISGDRWESEWTLSPQGFAHDMDAQDCQRLQTLNGLRLRCIGPLQRLRLALHRGSTVGSYVLAVYDFLQETDFSGGVARRLSQLENSGDLQALQVTRQLYELLLHALEQLYAVQYDAIQSPEEFVRLMEILLSQYQVGSIPAVLDAVTVGEPSDLQHRATETLYLCGCLDGSFPQVATGGSLLNELDRTGLRTVGISLAPDENEQMDRAMVGAYALLCAPKTQLCLSVGGDPCAYLFTTLAKLYPEAVKTASEALSPDFATAKTFGLWLSQQDSQIPAPPEVEAYAAYLRQAAAYQFGSLTPQSVRGLYGTVLQLSASRIDRYADCRFAFFLHDGLKTRERKAAAFDAPVYGTFVHYVLEHTFRQVQAEGGVHAVTDERLQTIAEGHMEAFLREKVDPVLLRSQRFSYLLRRNFAEVARVASVLGAELRAGRFIPADFELTFAKGGALPPVEIHTNSGNARISGAVDRVDLLDLDGRTYFRVVDYKTGRKDFDYTDLTERRGLQMLIYMFALQQNGARYYGKPIHPAGVLYVPARDPLQFFSQRPAQDEEGLKNHRRTGLLLNDAALLQAMEPSGEQSPQLLPYRLAKDGPSGDLMDLEQLSQLRRYVNRELAALSDEIFGGSVQPNPYIRGAGGSCSYCPYGSVCHLDLCGSEMRVLKTTGAKEFWARLAQKEAQHG